jgi:DNA-binding transcriptional regulator YiaG
MGTLPRLVSGDTYNVTRNMVQLLMSIDTKNISITAGQMKAARALLDLSGEKLAELSGVSLVAIRRAEAGRGLAGMMRANADAIRNALEGAGIEFIPENGGGAGVRLRKPGGGD